jgi:hypothetical protein
MIITMMMIIIIIITTTKSGNSLEVRKKNICICNDTNIVTCKPVARQ